jgi:DNA-binding transcriptional MocR family regulator
LIANNLRNRSKPRIERGDTGNNLDPELFTLNINRLPEDEYTSNSCHHSQMLAQRQQNSTQVRKALRRRHQATNVFVSQLQIVTTAVTAAALEATVGWDGSET